jgi:hypothetical protein
MGLSLGVGRPAWTAEEDDDEDTAAKDLYASLNSILVENGLPPHNEPRDIPQDQIFEAQMWGYGGLHSVRRMAAHLACQGKLPSPDKYENDAAKDPMIEQLNQMQLGGMVGSTPRLLEECLTLAQAISLPIDMDHEAEEFWNNAESPPASGELWQMYGLEAFGLIRLIHGCQSSIRHKAVLFFA